VDVELASEVAEEVVILGEVEEVVEMVTEVEEVDPTPPLR